MKKITKSRRWSLLKKAVKENVYISKYALMDLLIVAYTSSFLLFSIPAAKDGISYIKHIFERSKVYEDIDTEELNEELENSITCATFDSKGEIKTGYYVKDRIIYTDNDEKLDLTNETKPLILSIIGIDTNTLREANLKKSNIEAIYFNFSAITNDILNELPASIKIIDFDKCDYINDLSRLCEVAPNLEELGIERMTSIDSFDFIYGLKNLKALYLNDTYGITDELLTYCKNNNITVTCHGNEVKNTKEIKRIASEILDDDMDDKQKIRTIITYIMDNIDYDINTALASNESPIEYALNNTGVCMSYSYLASALFKETGITSYRVNTNGHIWNLIELDGEYFYIDPTNVDSMVLTRIIYKVFGLSPFSMSDPEQNFLASTKDISSSYSNIPRELLEDVLAKEDEKTLISKYGSLVGIGVIWLLELAANIIFWCGVEPTFDFISDVFDTLISIHYSYKRLKKKELQLK